MSKIVLLTGISGFVGQHCAVELLRNGYSVRGSIRDRSKEQHVRDGIGKVVDSTEALEFVQLDLRDDAGWDKAMNGVEYLLHVASPVTLAEPSDQNEIIKPALDGTLRALTAAKKAGVKKVVITSSTVAMAGDKKKIHLTPDSWTDPINDNVSAYIKSKAVAERAAWEFYKKQRGPKKMELTVVNPGPIFGPTLTGDVDGFSLGMFKGLMTGETSSQPNMNYVMSDVRDIAKIHVSALTNKESDGKRFIVTTEETHSFFGIATFLKENGYEKVRPQKAPSLIVRFMSLFNREVKGMLPFVDVHVTGDISSTKRIFKWQPTPFDKTLLDTAKSIEPYL